jgi:hypothetical protein
MQYADMKKDAFQNNNDNLDPWTSVGSQTAMLLNQLRCQAQILDLTSQQKESCEENPQPRDETERRPEQHGE